MQYLLLIYENEERFSQGYDPEEMSQYQAFGTEFAKNIKGGNALRPTNAAKTVRLRNGKAATTDAPFAETKEQLGGYYLVDAADEKRPRRWLPRFRLPASARSKFGQS